MSYSSLFFILTEEVGQPLFLAVMLNCHAHRVEEYEQDDKPIKGLSLDHLAGSVADAFFEAPESFTSSLVPHL